MKKEKIEARSAGRVTSSSVWLQHKIDDLDVEYRQFKVTGRM